MSFSSASVPSPDPLEELNNIKYIMNHYRSTMRGEAYNNDNDTIDLNQIENYVRKIEYFKTEVARLYNFIKKNIGSIPAESIKECLDIITDIETVIYIPLIKLTRMITTFSKDISDIKKKSLDNIQSSLSPSSSSSTAASASTTSPGRKRRPRYTRRRSTRRRR